MPSLNDYEETYEGMDEKHVTDTVGGQIDLMSYHSPTAEHTESPSLLVSPGFVINELVTLKSRDISGFQLPHQWS